MSRPASPDAGTCREIPPWLCTRCTTQGNVHRRDSESSLIFMPKTPLPQHVVDAMSPPSSVVYSSSSSGSRNLAMVRRSSSHVSHPARTNSPSRKDACVSPKIWLIASRGRAEAPYATASICTRARSPSVARSQSLYLRVLEPIAPLAYSTSRSDRPAMNPLNSIWSVVKSRLDDAPAGSDLSNRKSTSGARTGVLTRLSKRMSVGGCTTSLD